MKFDPNTKMMMVSPDELSLAYMYLRHAIKHIRIMAGKPLEGSQEHGGQMESPDFAECGIIDAMRSLGIHVEKMRLGELDVRDAG